MANNRPLNVGLVGGASGFISNAHQRAIFMDGTRRVTCAALSSNPEKALQAASEWPYPIEGYECYDAMLEAELKKTRRRTFGLCAHSDTQSCAFRSG